MINPGKYDLQSCHFDTVIYVHNKTEFLNAVSLIRDLTDPVLVINQRKEGQTTYVFRPDTHTGQVNSRKRWTQYRKNINRLPPSYFK